MRQERETREGGRKKRGSEVPGQQMALMVCKQTQLTVLAGGRRAAAGRPVGEEEETREI